MRIFAWDEVTIRRLVAVLVAPVMLAVGASGAAAEPFVVRGAPGSILVLDFEGDFFRFAGDGFAVNQTGPDNIFHFFVRPRPGCDPCSPGDAWDPSFRTDGEIDLGVGNARFGTVSHPEVRLFGTLDFAATPVTFEPPTNEFFFMRTPFTFNGQIRGITGGQQVFAADFVGTGTALRVFDPNEDGRWVGGENQFQYRFADPSEPVPEPATLLLFGAGAAVAAARKRRRLSEALRSQPKPTGAKSCRFRRPVVPRAVFGASSE